MKTLCKFQWRINESMVLGRFWEAVYIVYFGVFLKTVSVVVSDREVADELSPVGCSAVHVLPHFKCIF